MSITINHQTNELTATSGSVAVNGTVPQATLVSGINIKTVNGSSLLGSGDLVISGGGGGGDVTLTDAQTLVNKRVTPRVVSIASASTITPTGDTADQYVVTAQAAAATIAAPSGTPTDGQRLILRIEDSGTAQALTWTTGSGAYRAVGVTLPTTTVAAKSLYVGMIYNSQDVFWDVLATAALA